MTLQEFIHMNGFGFYVWSSYLVVALAFISLIVMFRMQRKQLINQIKRRMLLDEQRKNDKPAK